MTTESTSKYIEGALYHEHLEQGQRRVFTVEKVVCSKTTAQGQLLDIVVLQGYGLTMFLDGVRQSSESDEFVYHEMLVHPALFSHPNPRRVLIAGGGEGATAREVLRHRTVEKAVQVDLDPEVIALSKKHLPTWGAGAYEDPRLELVIGDILDYLRDREETFDAIILDIPECIDGTPLENLYSLAFFELVKKRLAPDGLVIGQIGPVHPTRSEAFLPHARTRRRAFAHVDFLLVPETGWIFGLASPKAIRRPTEAEASAERLSSPIRYWSPDVQQHLTWLPRHLASQL